MFSISVIKTKSGRDFEMEASHLNKQSGRSGVFESLSDCLLTPKAQLLPPRHRMCVRQSLLLIFLAIVLFWFFLRWSSLSAWVIFRGLLTRLSGSPHNESLKMNVKTLPLHRFHPPVH